MEASASAPAAADDPFAGAPTAASDDPFAEGAAPPADVPPADVAVEEPPIVDREGTRQDGATAVPANPHDPPAPPLSKAERERAAAALATGGSEAAEAEAEAPAQPPVEPQAEGGAEQPEPQPPVEPQEAPERPVEPQEAPAGGEPPQQPPTDTGAGESGGADEQPPEPVERKQTRIYKLLYQTGPTTWEETAIPDEYAEVVPDEVHGPQRFLKARNNDHARRLAFHIHDRPTAGVTIVPIPASSWKPKRVKPAPPRPERERLEIE